MRKKREAPDGVAFIHLCLAALSPLTEAMGVAWVHFQEVYYSSRSSQHDVTVSDFE